MIVSKKYKFVFLATTKTGTRSLYKILRDEDFCGELIGDHKHIIPDEYNDYYKFIVVRNPYVRMLSLYLSCCVEDGDVKGFMEEMSINGHSLDFVGFLEWLNSNKQKFYNINMSKYLILKSQASFFVNDIDLTIKFEDMSNGLAKLPFVKSELDIPKINVTKVVHDKKVEYWTQRALNLVNDYCDEEFNILGYNRHLSLDALLDDIY